MARPGALYNGASSHFHACCNEDSKVAWNNADAYGEPAPERRRRGDNDGSIRMLGVVVLLTIQAVIWFEIGYAVCKWMN